MSELLLSNALQKEHSSKHIEKRITINAQTLKILLKRKIQKKYAQ